MKKEISWILAIIITAWLSVLQLIMGSTTPLKSEVNTGNDKIQIKLIRSFTGKTECPVKLTVADIMVSGYLLYRLKSDTLNKIKIDFKREGDKLVCFLPNQPVSTEVEYEVYLLKNKSILQVNGGKPTLLSFKGKVPFSLILYHGALIFTAIFFSTLTGLFAGFCIKSYKWMNFLSLISFAGLGLFVNPLIQKLSLDKVWSGIPHIWDLNSKILLALLVWSITIAVSLWKTRRITSVLAAIITIAIFLIPHPYQGEIPVKITMEMIESNFIALLQLM